MRDFWPIPTGWRVWPVLVANMSALVNARGDGVLISDAMRNAARDMPTRERAADFAPWRPNEPVSYSHWGMV